MTRAAVLVLVVLAGCASTGPGPGIADVAGDWRGRWSGVAGHAVAALTVEPGGAYRLTMFLDGGDRRSAGVLMALPSGRLRYLGADGNGWATLEHDQLRFRPDGGGGSGLFDRVR